jgi:hypothetical protein
MISPYAIRATIARQPLSNARQEELRYGLPSISISTLIAAQKARAQPVLDPKRQSESRFAAHERNQPARRLIPKHEANAGKTLSQSEPADIAEIGMVAKGERQPVKWNSADEVVDMVHTEIGGEPA